MNSENGFLIREATLSDAADVPVPGAKQAIGSRG
jgi:hypothetical protein